MGTYVIEDTLTGNKLKVYGDEPPTQEDINNIIKKYREITGFVPDSTLLKKTVEQDTIIEKPKQENVQSRNETNKKTYFGGLKQFFVKDIPENIKGSYRGAKRSWELVGEPTGIGELLNLSPYSITDALLGSIERFPRALSAGLSTAGSVASGAGGTVLDLLNALAYGIPGETLSDLTKRVAENPNVQSAILSLLPKLQSTKEKFYSFAPQSLEATAESLGRGLLGGIDIGIYPFGFWAGKAAAKAGGQAIKSATQAGEDIARGAGEKLIQMGERGLMRHYKVTKPILRQVDESFYEAQKQLIRWITELGLEGRPGDVANKSLKMLDKYIKKLDDIITSPKYQDIKFDGLSQWESIKSELLDNSLSGTLRYTENEIHNAISRMEKIINGVAKKYEIDVNNMTPQQLVKLKRAIKEETDLFAHGSIDNETNLLATIGRQYYLRLADDINNKIPEIGEINDKLHKLFIVNDAIQEAANRMGKRDKFGIVDALLWTPTYTYLFYAPLMGQNLDNALKVTLLSGLANTIIRSPSLLGEGRGAGALIKAGKLLGGLEK